MENIINFNILRNPANWVIIFFVLYLAALVAHVMFEAAFNGGSAIQLPEGM
jgi:hypothetical protein